MKALGLQFFDHACQLVHRCTDVGQFDDVGFWKEGALAQISQVIGHLLLRCQVVWKLTQNSACNRNVTRFNFDVSRLREGLNDW